MSNKIIKFFLSFFYIGYIKYAPGTIASFITMLFVWFFIPNLFLVQFKILLFSAFFSMLFLFYFFEKKIDVNKDPQYIVVDEVVGMMISLLLVPKIFSVYLFAFFLFRIFDILKPSIIYESQKINYGIGVILDDVLAGVFAFLILSGIFNV
tara:strand:- start:148 stop:600 length:453 start_codon:yes stop_codon:yes gene_type:complete